MPTLPSWDGYKHEVTKINIRVLTVNLKESCNYCPNISFNPLYTHYPHQRQILPCWKKPWLMSTHRDTYTSTHHSKGEGEGEGREKQCKACCWQPEGELWRKNIWISCKRWWKWIRSIFTSITKDCVIWSPLGFSRNGGKMFELLWKKFLIIAFVSLTTNSHIS